MNKGLIAATALATALALSAPAWASTISTSRSNIKHGSHGIKKQDGKAGASGRLRVSHDVSTLKAKSSKKK